MYPIIKQDITNSFEDFINHWHQFYNYKVYHDNGDNLYIDRIKKEQYTEEDIKYLFLWKNGRNLSESKLNTVTKITSKLTEINKLKKSDFEIDEFQRHFTAISDGVWKIFLLHIISPEKYPIFDQHVHRAYTYLKYGEAKEIPSNRKKIIEIYLEDYLPYVHGFGYKTFEEIRKMDMALFAFGQFLKGNYRKVIE